MSTVFPPAQIGELSWDFSRTLVMGVVNITPDSFYDGGRYHGADTALDHALALAEQGADLLDLGGESTRPGAATVTAQEEMDRVLPVLSRIGARSPVPVSVDTRKPQVAAEALKLGAAVINDIAGTDPESAMPAALAGSDALYVLGHLRGEPATMNRDIKFSDAVAEVGDELGAAVRRAVDAGLHPRQIWIDPGIGFGKAAPHSLALLQSTGRIREAVGRPILVGPSRKSFIGEVTGQPVQDRLMGTCAAVAAVIQGGADAVRVHDVEALRPAIQVADAIAHAGEQGG